MMDRAGGPLRLIVNADDFGRTAGINRGILRAHEYGIVTSTSLMVRWPAAAEAAELARAHPLLSVGLHLDLSEWVRASDAWQHVYEVVPLGDPAAVAREVDRQLAEFRRLMGRDPTHLDAHQGVHRDARVAFALVEAPGALGIPLRDYTEGVRSEGGFYGRTSSGEPYPEGIGEEALIALLDRLRPGVTELRCHPGEPGDWDGGGYAAEREREIETLCSPEVRAALVRRGIRLSSFHELERPELVPISRDGLYRDKGIDAYNRRAFEEADRWFERAIAREAHQPWNWLLRARSRLALGDAAGSSAAAKTALELSPDYTPALLHEAKLLRQEGRLSECRDVLDRIHGAHPREIEVLREVARRTLELGDLARARQVAESILKLDPGDEQGVLTMATTLWKSGEGELVREFLEEALESGRESVAVGAVRHYLEVGDPGAARRAARRVGESNLPRSLLLKMGNDLRKRGYITAARETFQRIVALDPGDREAFRAADQLEGEENVLRGTWGRPSLHVDGSMERVPGRILHLVGHSLPYSQVGYTLRTHYAARAQSENGLDPRVVTSVGFPWNQPDVETDQNYEGVRYYRLKPPEGTPRRLDERLSLNIQAAAELVRRLRPSVLHAASDYRNALIALELGRAFRIPVVYEVRGFWEETRLVSQGHGARRRQCYQWHRQRELECMLAADRVVTLSEIMADAIVERGVPPHAVTIVPNAVDIEAFVPSERDPQLAQRLGIPDGEVVLGYISSLNAYEGIPVLLHALAELVARGLPARGLIVGEGSERTKLQAYAAELGIDDRVIFTGRVPHQEILGYYGLIDVFVVPRVDERVSRLVVPLKPYEAMATGRALVVSDVAALREMIEEGVNGLLFRAGDAQDLACIVEPLLRDPASREALGRSARQWVTDHRSWRENGARYLALYRSLGAV